MELDGSAKREEKSETWRRKERRSRGRKWEKREKSETFDLDHLTLTLGTT